MYRYRIKDYIGFILLLSVLSFMVFYSWVFEPIQKKDTGRALLEGPLYAKVKIKKTLRQEITTTRTNDPTKFRSKFQTNINCVNCTSQKRPTSKAVHQVVSSSDTNEERLARLKMECKKNPGGFKSKAGQPYRLNTILSTSQKVIFCQIQKSASTFWKKLVFNYTIVGLKGLPSLYNLKTEEENFQEDFFKFSFVREPYHRLFSAYVDKLFTPNVLYWRIAGIKVKSLSRSEEKKIKCGHDVTFAEFLDYVVVVEQTPEKRDRHFFSVYEHCEPCDHKSMNYIGKMETFDRDAQLILKSIKADNKTVSQYYDLRAKSKMIDIQCMVKRLFDTKKAILKCMTMYEAVSRIWRRLQIKGIIGRNIVFPFTPKSVKTLTRAEFEGKLCNAHIQSRTDNTIKYNKDDAFSEAYASVPDETLLKLKDIVKKDCLLFGYEIQPENVFNATMFLKSKFSFFQV